MHYLLTLNFDAEASGGSVSVSITGPGGNVARLAPGDALGIKACSFAPENTQSKVASLILVATPGEKKPQKRLSPFNKYDACTIIKSWSIPEKFTHSVGVLTVVSALDKLIVTANSGAWRIDGYLSVLTQKPRNNGGTRTRARLNAFSFNIKIGGE